MRIPSDLNVKNKKDHLKLKYFECIMGITYRNPHGCQVAKRCTMPT